MKDPALLFYTSDFLTGTVTMNMEDRGKYITILCVMHQSGRLTEETIRFLVGSISVSLKDKFKVDDEGRWFNEKLEECIEKRHDFVKSRRANGKLGGRPKKLTEKKPTGSSMGKPTNNHMGNGNEIENINEKEKKVARKKSKAKPASLPPDLRKLIPESWPLDELNTLWADFVHMRQKKKKPLTRLAAKRLVNQLIMLSGNSWDHGSKIIIEATDRSWDKFYPVDTISSNQKTTRHDKVSGSSGIRFDRP